MKKFSIALFSFLTVVAFAQTQQVTLKGQPALELYDRLERTGVETNKWTNDANGVTQYSLSIRKLICDYNTHTDPRPSLCTVLPGYMKKPIVSEEAKARKVLDAMNPVVTTGDDQGLYFGDCAMGKCTVETGNVNCYFDDNDQANAVCTVDAVAL